MNNYTHNTGFIQTFSQGGAKYSFGNVKGDGMSCARGSGGMPPGNFEKIDSLRCILSPVCHDHYSYIVFPLSQHDGSAK